jgi:hypothetical protein
MPTPMARTLEQQIEEANRLVARLQLCVEQQLINVSELSQHPDEAKKARATADRWLAELSILRLRRLNLYQQLAFAGRAGSKAS